MLPTRADMESAPTTRGMGFALCLCNTKAKLAIKQALKGEYVICQKSIFSNTTVQKNLF